MDKKEIVLKSGKHVEILMPPMSLDFIFRLQEMTIKKVLVQPEVFAILTRDDIHDLFLQMMKVNGEYWTNLCQRIGAGGLNRCPSGRSL